MNAKRRTAKSVLRRGPNVTIVGMDSARIAEEMRVCAAPVIFATGKHVMAADNFIHVVHVENTFVGITVWPSVWAFSMVAVAK